MKMPTLPNVPGLSREAARPLLFMASALLIWIVSFSVWSGIPDMESRSRLNYRRFEELIDTIQKYRNLPNRDEKKAISEDPMVVVSSLIESMGLKDNLIQISSLSKGVSVQLARLYAGKSLDFIQELGKRGLSIESAELRAVPEGDIRLLSMTLMVAVER